MQKYVVALDQKFLNYLYNKVQNWKFANIFFAQYLIYTLPLFLLWLWFYEKKSKKVVLRIIASVVLAWQVISQIVGQLVDRARPFEFGNVRELVFHRPTYSFPSDHAAALFAVVGALWFAGNRKMALVWLVVAIAICFFRVATGIHWTSDIIAGIIIGLIASWLVDLFDKPLNIAYEFVIKVAEKLRLA